MADGLQIIAPRLLITNMGIDGGVPGRARQILALTERDVLALGVFVLLGQAKVDDVDVVLGLLVTAHQEIVRLDVTVDDPLFVHFLNAANLQRQWRELVKKSINLACD